MPFCGAVISEMIKVLEAGGSPEYLGLDEQKMMRCTTSFIEAASVSEEIIDWMGLEEAEPEAE